MRETSERNEARLMEGFLKKLDKSLDFTEKEVSWSIGETLM